MSQTLNLRILVQDALACEISLGDPLELGRPRAGEPPPYQPLPPAEGNPPRLITAPQQDKDNIPRRQLTLTLLPNGRVRVSNHSQACSMASSQSGQLEGRRS